MACKIIRNEWKPGTLMSSQPLLDFDGTLQRCTHLTPDNVVVVEARVLAPNCSHSTHHLRPTFLTIAFPAFGFPWSLSQISTMYVTAKSYLSRSVPEILHRLGKLSTLDLQAHTVLFSISPAPSCSNTELTELVTLITALPSTLGCLSAPVNLRGPMKPTHAEAGYTLCSVAVFDRQNVTPFRSTIPGKEATQVGRWHAFRKGEDAKLDDHGLPREGSEVDWESVWAQKEYEHERPKQLKHLRLVNLLPA